MTWCNRHVTVIPGTSLTLTTIRNVTGRMAPGGVVKFSRDDSIQAGLAMSAGRGRGRRRHALTFHRSNVLLKPHKTPGGSSGVVEGPPGCRLARGSLSRPSGGHIAHEFSYLHRNVHHVAYYDDRGRTDPLLCHKAFHLFQR